LANCLKHAISVLQHVIVPETDRPIAEGFQRPSASGIDFFSVLAAIELNDQTRFPAGEIGDVIADWELPDELGTFELAGSQMMPESFLCVRAAGAQPACDRRQALLSQS
jgi:hypothetical protein